MTNIAVLVVDDQADLRLLVRTMIQAENHGLVCEDEAASGEAAVEFFDARADDAQVVVLDQMMPGMTGTEAAREILERHPDKRIILFSAYIDERLKAESREIGIRACLDKRDYSSVVSTIRQVADG